MSTTDVTQWAMLWALFADYLDSHKRADWQVGTALGISAAYWLYGIYLVCTGAP